MLQLSSPERANPYVACRSAMHAKSGVTADALNSAMEARRLKTPATSANSGSRDSPDPRTAPSAAPSRRQDAATTSGVKHSSGTSLAASLPVSKKTKTVGGSAESERRTQSKGGGPGRPGIRGLQCPVCRKTPPEKPFRGRCGCVACYACWSQSLKSQPSNSQGGRLCPCCGAAGCSMGNLQAALLEG